jgi:hypothetical protein
MAAKKSIINLAEVDARIRARQGHEINVALLRDGVKVRSKKFETARAKDRRTKWRYNPSEH